MMQNQAQNHEYWLFDVPGYSDWADQKIEEGESPATMAHLESISLWLSPEEFAAFGSTDLEEALQDLKNELGEPS